MQRLQSLGEWMQSRQMSVAELAQSAGLDRKVVQAIAEVRYTTSPQQRQRIADVFRVLPDEIDWGQAVEVDHMYGHGPQFGRSP